MTKYTIKMVDGHPCAIADPNGFFYSTGEVDREIVRLKLEPVRNTDDEQTVERHRGTGDGK